MSTCSSQHELLQSISMIFIEGKKKKSISRATNWQNHLDFMNMNFCFFSIKINSEIDFFLPFRVSNGEKLFFALFLCANEINLRLSRDVHFYQLHSYTHPQHQEILLRSFNPRDKHEMTSGCMLICDIGSFFLKHELHHMSSDIHSHFIPPIFFGLRVDTINPKLLTLEVWKIIRKQNFFLIENSYTPKNIPFALTSPCLTNLLGVRFSTFAL